MTDDEICPACSGQCPSCGFDIDGLREENRRLVALLGRCVPFINGWLIGYPDQTKDAASSFHREVCLALEDDAAIEGSK